MTRLKAEFFTRFNKRCVLAGWPGDENMRYGSIHEAKYEALCVILGVNIQAHLLTNQYTNRFSAMLSSSLPHDQI